MKWTLFNVMHQFVTENKSIMHSTSNFTTITRTSNKGTIYLQCKVYCIINEVPNDTLLRTAWTTSSHTRLTALFPGLPGSAGTRKVKTIRILLKQEKVSGSGISWAICKSAPSSRQITMPATHHSVFLQAGCPSCRPTNSVKALKASCLLISC